MVKKLLFNVLLKRGASAAEELLGKAVRHGMTTVGGALLTNGLATSDDVTALTGGAVALLGVAVSAARIWVKENL